MTAIGIPKEGKNFEVRQNIFDGFLGLMYDFNNKHERIVLSELRWQQENYSILGKLSLISDEQAREAGFKDKAELISKLKSENKICKWMGDPRIIQKPTGTMIKIVTEEEHDKYNSLPDDFLILVKQ